MAQIGLQPESLFKIKKYIFSFKKSQFHISGDFRLVFAQVEELKSQLVEFKDRDQDLLDPLKGIKDNLAKNEENESKEIFKALLIEFDLRKGSYATMMIRELLHLSTSYLVQMELKMKEKEKIDEKNKRMKIREEKNN